MHISRHDLIYAFKQPVVFSAVIARPRGDGSGGRV
jgi:hypothetical protein